MDRLARLELEVAELKCILNTLVGRQEGSITLREMRLAAERGDKLTVEKYWEQERKSGTIGRRV